MPLTSKIAFAKLSKWLLRLKISRIFWIPPEKKLEFTTGRYLKARENYLPVKEAYEREFRLFLDTQAGILAEAGVTDTDAVNRLLNQEIKCAIERGMKVLYCIGEKSEEQEQWQEVLGKQLEIGLKDVDTSKVVIAYEPIWSIGPGKTPAGKEYITKIAKFVKEKTNGMDIVYGGGLKQDNAEMLASIDEIDGGLIALTRFQGEIGYYPEEYLEIIRLYMGKVNNR